MGSRAGLERNSRTAPRFGLLGSPGSRPWLGKVDDASFELRRRIHYKNPFLPTVRGTLEPTNSGTRVHARLRMHLLVQVFMAVWIGFATLAAVVLTAGVVSSGTPPLALFVWVMPVFGAAMTHFAFSYEARRATELLEAQLATRATTR